MTKYFNSAARSKQIKQTKAKMWNKAFNLATIGSKFLGYLADAVEQGYIAGREFSDVRGTFTPFWDELEEERAWFRKEAGKRRIIRELKKRRLIEEQKLGNKMEYALTAKGAAHLARYQILNCKKQCDNNRFCLVIFDIPESQRHIRDLLRKFLKEAGFKRIQQSAWATQNDVAHTFQKFVKSISADHWVNIFIVESIILAQSKSIARRIKISK